MTSKEDKARAAWGELNQRQRLYLSTIFDMDQDAEDTMKARKRRWEASLTGSALSPRYVRAMLARSAERAGIDKRVHPHGLRHTHAAELDREGWPTAAIQDQLGHTSLATTDRYLAHISPTDRIARARLRDRTL